jgi:tRNA (guanine-N7-)-methyltransferase
LIEKPEELPGKWRQRFPGYKKLYLELGCGKGTFTAATAEQNPDALFMAVEKVPDAMVMAMEKACERGVENVRFIDTRRACCCRTYLPPARSTAYTLTSAIRGPAATTPSTA